MTENFSQLAWTPRIEIWSAPPKGPFSQNVWAPELHHIDGRWICYFAADDGKNENHRIWALRSVADDPRGPYEMMGRLDTGGWAIDATTFIAPDGRRFCAWSGWPGETDGVQNLYLAPMSDPFTIAGPRRLLARPTKDWERRGMPICEAPQYLEKKGRPFVVYSAGGSWTRNYCLGLLEFRGGNFTAPASWKKTGPVFESAPKSWGPGHCSFTKTPDGRDWIFYHAKSSPKPGWTDRAIRAQPFLWKENGRPFFGEPAPPGVALPAP